MGWHGTWLADREAVVCGDVRLTWAQFNARINTVANALRRRGIRQGDAVAVLMQNSVEMATVLFGVLRAGAVLVPLSAMITTETVDMMLRDAGARAVFVAAPLRQLVEPLLGSDGPIMPGGHISVGFAGAGWRAYEAFLAPADTADPGTELRMDDPFVIMYSSGTTGTPKGIVHTHYSRLMLALRGNSFRFSNASRTILTTAMYNNGTWVPMLSTFYQGGTVVIMPQFDAGDFLALVARERGTHVLMVPTQYIVTLAHPDFDTHDTSSLAVLISVGSPLRATTKAEIRRRFSADLFELYGLTEGVGTLLLPQDMERKLGSVGRPYPGSDIRIIDDAGRELPWGETGEIIGYGSGMMRGYHNRPAQTAEVMWPDAHGRIYLKTGDIGRLDEDGFLYILDRKKDMIISGGINIFATDIETVIAGHPAVLDVTVIGVPHAKWGETPLALVIPKPGADATPEALAAWANARLGKYQRVSGVVFREEFPRNALGKVLKRELREQFAQA
jgi:acyl-CoA synthetase (AMP-forming)/AMP-acid ligase II